MSLNQRYKDDRASEWRNVCRFGLLVCRGQWGIYESDVFQISLICESNRGSFRFATLSVRMTVHLTSGGMWRQNQRVRESSPSYTGEAEVAV